MLTSLIFFAHGFSAVASLALIIYVVRKDHPTLLSKTAAGLFLCISIWSLGNLFVQRPSTTEHAAWLWGSIAAVGWSVMTPILLLFFLLFAGRTDVLRRKSLYLILFFIPALVNYQQWNNSFLIFVKESYGWGIHWPATHVARLFYILELGVVVACVSVINSYVKEEKNEMKIRQAKLIVVNTYASFVLIFLNSVVMPVLELTFIPVMGDVIAFLWALGLIYGDKKYGLFREEDILRPSSQRF